MNDTLLWILSIIGIFVIYWIFVGQGKHRQMMQGEELARLEAEQRAMAEKNGGDAKTPAEADPKQKI